MKKIFLLVSLLCSLSCFAQVPAYAPSNGIVAFWPFSGNANDATGNGNNGTVNGAILTTDRFGGGSGAYYFNNTVAANSYIQLNVNTTAINTSGAMTLSFWINRVGNGYLGSRAMEFGSCSNCAGQILVTWANLNSLQVRHYVTATQYVSDTITTATNNVWYNIVYTNDGTTAKFYLNGSLVETEPSPAAAQLLGSAAFGRMNHPAYDAFNGDLDDIGLWSRALTPCEVNNLYTGNASTSFAFNPLQDTTYICDSITLDAGAGYSAYLWNTGQSTETITAKNNGEYTVTATNNVGCMASDSTQIIILKPTVTASQTNVCAGNAVTLTATGIAGSSQTLINQFSETFLAPWSFNVNTVVGQSYLMIVSGTASDHCVAGDTFNNTDPGFFYDRSPVQDVNSATAPDRLYDIWNGVQVRPDGDTVSTTHTYNYTLPAATQTVQPFSYADAGGPGAYGDNCGSMSFQFYQINKSSATYTWSANPAATAGLNPADINNQNLIVNPTVTTTYYVTVNDGVTSCEDSILITVATIDTSITSSDSLSVCSSGGTVHLHAGIDASYQWLKNGTPIAGATSKDYTVTQTGAYSVIGFTAAGCNDTSRALTIGMYPQPVAGFNISSAATQCLRGNSFSFTNTSTISAGTLSYKWLFGDGNNAASTNAVYSYATANSYNVQLIDSSNNGCMDTTAIQTVVVKPPTPTPTVAPGGPLSFCGTVNATLTSSATSGNQWYNNGVSIPTATNQTYNATAAGIYNVISNANTCTSDSSNDVTIIQNAIPPTPTITVGGSLPICGSGSVVLTSSAAAGNKWYFNGSPIAGATDQNYTASAAGNYHVIVTISTCSSNVSDDTTVTIVPLPTKPTITSTGTDTLCPGGSVLLTSSSTSGNQWFNNAVPVSGAVDNMYIASAAGSYTVGVSNVCAGNLSDPTIVLIQPSPAGIRYSSINVEVGTAFPLQARNIGDHYLWTPGTGLSDDNTADPTTDNFTHTQDYVIQIIKTGANCITYDSLLINAYEVKGLLVPTAFSPNGDGKNDKLNITLINIKQLNYFRIYDEWGKLLFQTSNSGTGWDGTYQGVPQPIANYVWVAEGVDGDGKSVTDHGSVMIVR